jgi:hypothetical protein
MPNQLISMADDTLKPIVEVRVGDKVKVYDEKLDEFKDSSVNEIMTKLHTNVYELYLENGKILKPNGNHPFLTKDKGWTTIDGHNPNHGGGSGYLKVEDYVKDIETGWVKVTDINAVEGEYLTYNFIDMEYGTIIADGIITHNTGLLGAGGGGGGGTGGIVFIAAKIIANSGTIQATGGNGGFGGTGDFFE